MQPSDYALMESGLLALVPAQVFEIRILGVQRYAGGTRKNILSGMFDSPQRAVESMREVDRKFPEYNGAYLTFNPITPSVLARSPNRLDFLEQTVKREDISERRWLMVDIDPDRPSGISSSDAERDLAVSAARVVYQMLRDRFSGAVPVSLRSGNGVHLLYRIQAGLAEDDELVCACLKRISRESRLAGAAGVSIGVECYDLPRHTKLPGSLARKGSELPSQQRYWRLAEVKNCPASCVVIPRESLLEYAQPIFDEEKIKRQQLAAFQPQLTGEREKLNARDWLQNHGLAVSQTKPWHDGVMYLLEQCPWKEKDRDKAFVVQMPDGRIFGGCRHGGCTGFGWHDLRDLIEPGWREARKGQAWFGGEILAERRRKEMRQILREESWLWREFMKKGIASDD